MSRPLRRKIELAVTSYLQANAVTIGLTSAAIFHGASTEEPGGDWLCVSMGTLQPHPELPQVKLGKLTIQYKSAATKDGSQRSGVDTILEKVDTFVTKPVDDSSSTGWTDGNKECGALLVALNKPLVGSDTRTVTPLHIYYVGPSEEANDCEEEGWVDQLTYDVIAQPMNSH